MSKILFTSIILSLGFILFSCNNQAQTEEAKPVQTNKTEQKEDTESEKQVNFQKAPDFALKNSKGETIHLSSFEDKVIILNFWATWCGPCRREIPGFVNLYKKYNEEGLEIIGVSVDQNGWEAVNPFVKNYNINYPILMFNHNVVRDYGGIRGIPTTFIINREGKIIEKIVGLRPDAYFEQKVKELL